MFSSAELGEIAYAVKLVAENPPAMKVPTLRAELGKSEYYECVLENPTEKEVVVRGRVVGAKQGFAVDANAKIEPFGIEKAKIWFTPTDVDVN